LKEDEEEKEGKENDNKCGMRRLEFALNHVRFRAKALNPSWFRAKALNPSWFRAALHST